MDPPIRSSRHIQSVFVSTGHEQMSVQFINPYRRSPGCGPSTTCKDWPMSGPVPVCGLGRAFRAGTRSVQSDTLGYSGAVADCQHSMA